MKQGDVRRVGFVTPSSNTVLEPVTWRMLAGSRDAVPHFTRLMVTEIKPGERSAAQFDPRAMESAARLLGDARVHSVAWGGTSGAWLGAEFDETVCQTIAAAADAPATTSAIAVRALLAYRGWTRVSLWTPYRTSIQRTIVRNLELGALEIVAERHAGISVNYAFASIPRTALEADLLDLARERPDALVVLCTNVNAADVGRRLEARIGVPVVDSAAATVWHAARLARADTAGLSAWGAAYVDAGPAQRGVSRQ